MKRKLLIGLIVLAAVAVFIGTLVLDYHLQLLTFS